MSASPPVPPEPTALELIRSGLIAAVVMAAAVVVFYGTGIATGAELFFTHDIGGSDIWHLHYPMKHFYQQELDAGRMPLWSTEIGTGFPLHAEGQVAALYPFNLVLFKLLPLALAFNWGILLHAVLSGVFAAMFARQLGAGRSGSVLAAIVFAFSGFFVTHLKHINMTASAVWIPLLLLLLERQAAKPSLKTLAGFALTVGAMILAGHPQIVYNNLLVAGAYAAYLLIRVWLRRPADGGGGKPAARFGGGLFYAVLLGVLLGAAQILPTKELNDVGPRQGGMSLAEATQWEYRAEHLLAFILPKAFGDPGELKPETFMDPRTGKPLPHPKTGEPVQVLKGFEQDARHPMLFWEMTGYVGLLTLALAGVCLWLGWRRRNVIVLTVFLLVSLLLTLGKNGGLFYVFYKLVPGFSLFRFHDRFLLYADLVLAVLAGLGFTLLVARIPLARKTVVAAGLAILAGAICFADLKNALGDHNPKVEAGRWETPPPTAERIREAEAGRNALFRIAENDPERELFTNAYYLARGWKGDLSPYDPAKLMLDPNLNLLYGITNIHTYYQIYPRWMMDAAVLLTIPGDSRGGRQPPRINPRMAAIFNVKYVLDPFQAHEGVLPLLAEYDGGRRIQWPVLADHPRSPFKIRLHENPAALPRAFLVPRARVVIHRPVPRGQPTPGQRALLDPAFDPGKEVLIHRTRHDPAILGGIPGEPIESPVEFLEYGPRRVRLKVDAPRGGWLFLSDTYYPGWTATVDGKETEIHRANITGRAVAIKTGSREVVFTYAPRSFRNGLILLGLGVVLLLSLRLQRRIMNRFGRT